MLQIGYIIKKRTLKHFSLDKCRRVLKIIKEFKVKNLQIEDTVSEMINEGKIIRKSDGFLYEINILDIVYFLFFYFHLLLLDYIFNLKVIYKLCCGNKRTHTFYADYFSNALYHSLNILYFSYFYVGVIVRFFLFVYAWLYFNCICIFRIFIFQMSMLGYENYGHMGVMVINSYKFLWSLWAYAHIFEAMGYRFTNT